MANKKTETPEATETITAPEVDAATRIADLEAENDALKEANAELQLQLAGVEGSKIAAAPKASGIPSKPVKSGGKKYVWQVPKIRVAGGHIVHADDATPEMIEAILAMEGQETLKEVK